MTCSLKKTVAKDDAGHSDGCDGCAEILPPDTPYITGIDSCCGGCYRRLCPDCVKKAYELLFGV